MVDNMDDRLLPLIGPNSRDRPHPPKAWVKTSDIQSSTWHHVIPYSLLRTVWNLMIRSVAASRGQEAPVALKRYLSASGSTFRNPDGWISNLRNRSLSVSQMDELARCAVWQPWNIVEGPSDRTDDPCDTQQHTWQMDRFTHGLTSDELARMRVVESLYEELRQIISAVSVTGNQVQAIGEAFLHRSGLKFISQPIAYRKTMWLSLNGSNPNIGPFRKVRNPKELTAQASPNPTAGPRRPFRS